MSTVERYTIIIAIVLAIVSAGLVISLSGK